MALKTKKKPLKTFEEGLALYLLLKGSKRLDCILLEKKELLLIAILL